MDIEFKNRHTDIMNTHFVIPVDQSVRRCPFCPGNIESKIRASTETMVAIEDTTPVTRLHMLIIPRRHCADYFELTPEEKKDADTLLHQLKQSIILKDPTVAGFNIGINCGECAGQTIFHTHIHLIPRRPGDTPRPRGGVRGVIPGRMNY